MLMACKASYVLSSFGSKQLSRNLRRLKHKILLLCFAKHSPTFLLLWKEKKKKINKRKNPLFSALSSAGVPEEL